VKDAFSEAGLRGTHGGSLTLYIQHKSPGADKGIELTAGV